MCKLNGLVYGMVACVVCLIVTTALIIVAIFKSTAELNVYKNSQISYMQQTNPECIIDRKLVGDIKIIMRYSDYKWSKVVNETDDIAAEYIISTQYSTCNTSSATHMIKLSDDFDNPIAGIINMFPGDGTQCELHLPGYVKCEPEYEEVIIYLEDYI